MAQKYAACLLCIGLVRLHPVIDYLIRLRWTKFRVLGDHRDGEDERSTEREGRGFYLNSYLDILFSFLVGKLVKIDLNVLTALRSAPILSLVLHQLSCGIWASCS